MGIFFTGGEQKKRPGVYQRYQNNSAPTVAGATNGIVAAVMQADSGQLGTVHQFYSADEAVQALGASSQGMVERIFAGGASQLKVVRLGSGGAAASAVLKDTAEPAQEVLKATARSVGVRPLRLTIREALGNAQAKELLVYENGVQLEKFAFAAAEGTTELDALLQAAAHAKYIALADMRPEGYTGQGALAQAADLQLTGGEAPSSTNGDYAAAFRLLEPHGWNALCVDSCDTGVHALLHAFLSRAHQDGKMAFGVVGEPVSVPQATRLEHAKAFNDEKLIYVGGGWYDSSNNLVDGSLAAAQICAMVAAVPSNESLTHRPVYGAAKVAELLANREQEEAIDSGMLSLSASADGVVWVEAGITTLNAPMGEKDEGWRKIKRTKIRFELMERVNATIEPLIGVINNSADGRATIVQTVQGLLHTMVAEGKLLSGAAVRIDLEHSPAGDSAWFVIDADDVDALEKVYFTFRFRFAAI